MPPPWVVAVAYRMYPYPTLLGSWGIEGSYDTDLQTFFPAHLALMTRLLHAVEGQPAHQRLLQLGAVDRVLSLHTQGYEGLTLRERLPSPFRGAIHVFDVPGSVPRTYVVARARRAEGMAAVAAILGTISHADEVVLSRAAGVAPGSIAAEPLEAVSGEGRAGSCRSARLHPHQAGRAADGYPRPVDTYDPEWRATVDGRPAPIVRSGVAAAPWPDPRASRGDFSRPRPWPGAWPFRSPGRAPGHAGGDSIAATGPSPLDTHGPDRLSFNPD
jgi:hypothetical protein